MAPMQALVLRPRRRSPRGLDVNIGLEGPATTIRFNVTLFCSPRVCKLKASSKVNGFVTRE